MIPLTPTERTLFRRGGSQKAQALALYKRRTGRTYTTSEGKTIVTGRKKFDNVDMKNIPEEVEELPEPEPQPEPEPFVGPVKPETPEEVSADIQEQAGKTASNIPNLIKQQYDLTKQLKDIDPTKTYIVTIDDKNYQIKGINLRKEIAQDIIDTGKGIQSSISSIKQSKDISTQLKELPTDTLVTRDPNTGQISVKFVEQPSIEAKAYERALETEYAKYKGPDIGEAAWLLWKNPYGSISTGFGLYDEKSRRKYFEETVFPERTKVFYEMAKNKDFKSAALYFGDNPFTYKVAFTGAQYGLGYIGGLSSTGKYVSQGLTKSVGLYTGYKTFEDAKTAASEGNLLEYGTNIATKAVFTLPFSGKTYVKGQVAGQRKRLISLAKNPYEKARLQTQFQTVDFMKRLPSTQRTKLDFDDIINLRGQPEKVKNLETFLSTKYGKRSVLGGSASQHTYIKTERLPHDIDLYFKKPFWRRASSFEKSFISKAKQYGVDTDVFDIHPLPKYKSFLPQRGTGYTLKPIRTPKGSAFKWQTTYAEQATRKAASTISPLHEFRGKDWVDTLDILKVESPKLYSEMSMYKPTLTSKMSLVKPAKLSSTYPSTQFTLFEKGIRKYTSSIPDEFFTTEAKKFIKPSGEPFRPKLIDRPKPIDPSVKTTYFFSGFGSSPSFKDSGYTPLIVIPPKVTYDIPKKKPKTTTYVKTLPKTKTPVYPYPKDTRKTYPYTPVERKPYIIPKVLPTIPKVKKQKRKTQSQFFTPPKPKKSKPKKRKSRRTKRKKFKREFDVPDFFTPYEVK